MKKFLAFLVIAFAILVGPIVAVAQCDRATQGAIRCGYYDEGYQDGISDAQNNRANDFRRYREKLDSRRYESSYQEGYNAGFTSIRPFRRWDNNQRSAYDFGYDAGDSDRRRNISRLPARYEGQYNRSFEIYYAQGYSDGYDNRGRNYDIPLGNEDVPTFPQGNPIPPSRGSEIGTLYWSGRVDNRVQIVIKGANVRSSDVVGSGFQLGQQTLSGVLPRRPSNVTLRLVEGRGNAFVAQQPSRENDWSAVIEVSDPKSGAGNYRLEVSWQSTMKEEPYQSGRVMWKGPVDITANIVIQGSSVQTQNVAGRQLFGTQQLTGYLAQRNGSVRATKLKGRGTVTIIQQPAIENDYTAIVQVNDAEKSDDDYEVEIVW